MPSYTADFPSLSASRVEGARLFANRADMLRGLNRKANRVAEIGVALGFGSDLLIDAFKPQEFVAFDIFALHELEAFWGKPSSEHLENKSHLEFYTKKMQGKVPNLVVRQGDSATELMTFPQAYFDIIYIDGDHSLGGVQRDIDACKVRISDDGILVFNDYVMLDTVSNESYGIIPCVNNLIMNDDWYVLGFAFQELMFCDIAICKTPATEYYRAKQIATTR